MTISVAIYRFNPAPKCLAFSIRTLIYPALNWSMRFYMCEPVPHSFEKGIFSFYSRRCIYTNVLSNSENTRNLPSFFTISISVYIFVLVSCGICYVSLLMTSRLCSGTFALHNGQCMFGSLRNCY